MPNHEITMNIDGNSNRQEQRKRVIEQFLQEEPGTGTGERTSRYSYYVEELEDGSWIYLTRPAYLKKGFDFLIHVQNKTFLNRKDYPKHQDIFEDLKGKKREDPELFKKLHKAISEVFHCKDPKHILKELGQLEFESGFTVELILKTIKWFFIEQDIRDWNYSGRGMFMRGIDEIAEQEIL